jgi:hypothetical protein
MDDSDPERNAIHDAIAASGPPGAVLTGWALVAEWMDDEGNRLLGKARAAETTPWNAKGMLHTMLFENTPWGEPNGPD